MSKRIYCVTVRQLSGKTTKTLVKAASPGQAVMHVTRETVDIRVASQDDMLELINLGGVSTPVEDATAESAE